MPPTLPNLRPPRPSRASSDTTAVLILSIVLLLLVVLLPGCSAFNDHRADLRALYAQGRFDHAAAVLDSPEVQKLYGPNEGLLYLLDRGSVALAQKDYDRAINLLDRAESVMEVRTELTTGDQITQWLLNDTARPYLGEPYENMYTNVLKLIGQLERGSIIGGATVEARRMATKANSLRDRFLKYQEAVESQGGAQFQRTTSRALPANGAAAGTGGLVTTNSAGEFIESPLGTFLTAVTFMHSGEPEYQRVAARRLVDSLRLQRGLVGPVDPADFEGLGDRPPRPGDVLIIALSGRGPTKRAERIGPIPVFDWPVYFELPVLEGGGSHIANARIIVEPLTAPLESTDPSNEPSDDPVANAASTIISRPPAPAPAPAAPPGRAEAIPLALVENMAAVANENHRRQLPLIYTRALLRSSLKAAASFAGTQAVRSSTRRNGRHSDGDDLAVLGAIIGGLAFVALTERADLRSWVFLPGQAHVGLFNLPPGEYRARVEYLAPNGGVVYAANWRPLSVPAHSRGEGGDLTTIVEHYWR